MVGKLRRGRAQQGTPGLVLSVPSPFLVFRAPLGTSSPGQIQGKSIPPRPRLRRGRGGSDFRVICPQELVPRGARNTKKGLGTLNTRPGVRTGPFDVQASPTHGSIIGGPIVLETFFCLGQSWDRPAQVPKKRPNKSQDLNPRTLALCNVPKRLKSDRPPAPLM